MKRKLALCFALAMILLTTLASARIPVARPYLSFSGTTAFCEGMVRSVGDEISITLTLFHGTTVLNSWTESGTDSVQISEQMQVIKNESYILELSGEIDGVQFEPLSVSGTC